MPEHTARSLPPRDAGRLVKLIWFLLVLAWVAFIVPRAGSGLLIGWPLNIAAFCLAILVIRRGRHLMGGLQIAAAVVISPLVYLLGLGLLILISAFSEVEVEHAPLPPREAPPREQPAAPPEAELQHVQWSADGTPTLYLSHALVE